MKIVAENIKDLFQINLCASRRFDFKIYLVKIVVENIKDLFQINLCASRRLEDLILKYIFNKYIYGRNILMQRRFSKNIYFSSRRFLGAEAL